MNFLSTTLGAFLWKLIITIVFVALMLWIVKSAADSLRRTGKWWSVIDEVVIGIIVLFAYLIVVLNDAVTIFNAVSGLIIFLWNLFIGFLRETLNLPI